MRLARVLRRIAHDAGVALLCRGDPEIIRFCIAQYNRVHTRLVTLAPEAATASTPLPVDASAGCVRIAARALAYHVQAGARAAQDHAPAWLDGFVERCLCRILTFNFS